MTAPEWRKIPGLPPQYEVSDEGEVRIKDYYVDMLYRAYGKKARRKVAGRTVKPYLHTRKSDGAQFPVISIKNWGDSRVNLLVARAFHGIPYDPNINGDAGKWRVMHIDGDTMNLNASNLRWIPNLAAGDVAARARQEDNIRAWESSRKEPAAVWLRKFYSDDEIDWETAEAV